MSRLARRTLTALTRRFPDAAAAATITEGALWFELPAPRGSSLGRLVVQTFEEALWVRIAPPFTGFAVSGLRELWLALERIMSDGLVFVVITRTRGDRWRSTTVETPPPKLRLRAGQTAHVWSWSGAHDAVVRKPALRRVAKSRPRPGR